MESYNKLRKRSNALFYMATQHAQTRYAVLNLEMLSNWHLGVSKLEYIVFDGPFSWLPIRNRDTAVINVNFFNHSHIYGCRAFYLVSINFNNRSICDHTFYISTWQPLKTLRADYIYWQLLNIENTLRAELNHTCFKLPLFTLRTKARDW